MINFHRIYSCCRRPVAAVVLLLLMLMMGTFPTAAVHSVALDELVFEVSHRVLVKMQEVLRHERIRVDPMMVKRLEDAKTIFLARDVSQKDVFVRTMVHAMFSLNKRRLDLTHELFEKQLPLAEEHLMKKQIEEKEHSSSGETHLKQKEEESDDPEWEDVSRKEVAHVQLKPIAKPIAKAKSFNILRHKEILSKTLIKAVSFDATPTMWSAAEKFESFYKKIRQSVPMGGPVFDSINPVANELTTRTIENGAGMKLVEILLIFYKLFVNLADEEIDDDALSGGVGGSSTVASAADTDEHRKAQWWLNAVAAHIEATLRWLLYGVQRHEFMEFMEQNPFVDEGFALFKSKSGGSSRSSSAGSSAPTLNRLKTM